MSTTLDRALEVLRAKFVATQDGYADLVYLLENALRETLSTKRLLDDIEMAARRDACYGYPGTAILHTLDGLTSYVPLQRPFSAYLDRTERPDETFSSGEEKTTFRFRRYRLDGYRGPHPVYTEISPA